MKERDDVVYRRDFERRNPKLNGPMSIQVAKHLADDPQVGKISQLLVAFQSGSDLSFHVSPMKTAKKAFKRAMAGGNWHVYSKLMDTILNKWGIYHFHSAGGSLLVFVYFDHNAAVAYVIDLISHNGDWQVERRLIGIVVENWPDAGIIEVVGRGQSKLTEANLLNARKRRVNAPVEVNGTFYRPSGRALMMDGSGYEFTDTMPIVIMGKRIQDDNLPENSAHPQMMMVGVDPDDPTPSWEAAAAEAGRLSAKRNAVRKRFIQAHRNDLIADCVRSVVMGYRV